MNLAEAFALAAARAQDKSRDIPDVFAGTIFIVDEIIDALGAAREAVIEIQAARATRSLSGMQAASAEFETLLRQTRIMKDSLDNVLRFHADLASSQESQNAG